MNGVGYRDDWKYNGEEVVNLSPLLSRVKRILQSYEEIDRIANVKADGDQLEKHVDAVVRQTEVVIGGNNVQVESEEVENCFDIEPVFKVIQVVSH